MTGKSTPIPVHDEDGAGTLTVEFVRAVSAALAADDQREIRRLTRKLHAADLADLIEHLRRDERTRFIGALGRAFKVKALTELDETVLGEVLQSLPNTVIASAVRRLSADDAVDLIEDLDAGDRNEILAKVPKADRAALERALNYQEDSAGRLMQGDCVAVPSFWTVGQTIDYLRSEKNLPDAFHEVYVVDPAFRPQGIVHASQLLRHPRQTAITGIMQDHQVVFQTGDTNSDIAYKFQHYNLVSAAVVDEAGKLAGAITIDDVVDVISEEAEEDILRLSGVSDAAMAGSVWTMTQSRLGWLLGNLATAILASWVISWFDATIEQMVALAVLMPIVASMGGNAGTQTMTVTVRALATRDLGPANAMRVIGRESIVGLINGFVFAALMGVLSWWWFASGGLGFVIGAAMVINMMAAALAGILIPLALDRFDIDPAVSSSIFITTITDVIGFFAFLGIAAWWLF